MSAHDLWPWSPTLKVIACAFHGVAIACTMFRLMYRWYMAQFWWEDGWATLALAVDIVCLVSAALQAPITAQGTTLSIDKITNWMAALGTTTVLWACRMSILLSIFRITNPSQRLRLIMFLIGCSFVIMWAAMMGQKIRICQSTCVMAAPVGLSQLITNVTADIVLVAFPIFLVRRAKIRQEQRVMLFSVFSALLLVIAVTIFHSVVLFTVESDGTIVISHIRTALLLIICNLLVTVTFICRVCRRGRAGDLDAAEDRISLTSVDLNTGFSRSISADKQSAPTVDELERVESDLERSLSTTDSD